MQTSYCACSALAGKGSIPELPSYAPVSWSCLWRGGVGGNVVTLPVRPRRGQFHFLDAPRRVCESGVDVVGLEVRVRAQPTAFDAYKRLLRWLADRQNACGLELLGQLGGL